MTDLKAELVATLDGIDAQTREMILNHGQDNIYKMKYINGEYILAPLLAARAQVLFSLALLEKSNDG